jgi:hypothetical protein
MPGLREPQQNHLLAALSPAERERIYPHLRLALCRWLLLSLDRLSSNQLTMTQELIANMLGVRREGVTEAAGKLEKLGVIRYARGHITVLDRSKLESMCCECYAVARKETDPSCRAPRLSETL